MSPTGEKPSDARHPPGSPEEQFKAQVAKTVRGKSPDDMAALRPQFEKLADELGVDEGNANRIVKQLEPRAKRPGARTPSGAPPATLRVTRLSEVKEESVRWLWRGRVPLGALTMLEGPPGVGKSTIAIDLAARLTTGRPMPGEATAVGNPAAVVLLTTEDNHASTVGPRVRSAGGNPHLVLNLTIPQPAGLDRELHFPADLPLLEASIVEHGALLVLVDPLVAFLDAEINPHLDKDVRRALGPFAAVAQRTGAACLFIRHLNKSHDDDPMTRGGGSIGFVAQARSGLLVNADPEDDTGERRVLASFKCNVGRKPPSLTYTLSARGDETVAHVEWGSETRTTARQLLGVPLGENDRTDWDEAADVICAELIHGKQSVTDVRGAVAKAGITISVATFNRVVRTLDVKRVREGFGPGSKIMLVPGPTILLSPTPAGGAEQYGDSSGNGSDQELEGVEGNGSRHTAQPLRAEQYGVSKANGKLPGTLPPAGSTREGA